MSLKKYLDYDGLAYLLQRFPKTTVHCSFDSEFAGETATLTHGTTTYTKTVPATSPFELTFAVNELGTWTLQSSYLGTQYSDTVDITYLGQKGEIELGIVPDGSTIEPINSIPIWLKCANLDKNYSTLADVLADTETYETLLADSNACQYLKRSTGWAGISNLVPKMTSNTTPEGTVSYSSQYSGYPWWWAFDGNIAAEHDGMISGTSGYVAYTFTSSKKITKVSFYNRTGVGGIKDFTVDYLDTDGTTWRTVYSGSATQESSKVKQEFVFDNDISSNTWRINILNGQGATNAIGLNGLQFHLAGITTSQDAMARLGKFDYASNLLLSDSTWCEAIASSDYWESVCNISVPKMTGDTAPSGQVLYTTQYNATYAAYKVFDKDLSTAWAAAASDSYGTMRVGYRFTKPQVIKVVSIDCSPLADPTRIVGFRIVAKDASETEWTTLLTVTNRNTNAKEYYHLNNSNAYTDYNIIIDSASGAAVDASRISELQFYGREKEVQYRATVPTMTSATTPSGVASDSGHYDYYDQYSGWHVFDGTTANYLSPQNSVNQWIAYTFPEAKTIKKMTIYGTPKANNESVPSVIKTQVKVNDNWIDLDTYNNSSTTLNATRYFENQYSSTDYRILFSGMVESKSFVNIRDLQFYEEVTGDVILHSAANDTIYCIDENDNQMPICTTDEKGVGKCDLTSFQAGPVTLYSSVAKNPDDLTADYSKTIMITKTQYGGTTEAYLMPDTIKTLYWWGRMDSYGEVMSTANGWNNSTYGFVAPTFNTNDFYASISNAANNWQSSGIGFKNAVTVNKMFVVGKCNGGEQIAQSLLVTQKAPLGTYAIATARLTAGNVLNTGTTELANPSTGYFCGCIGKGTTANINAVWYE